MAKESKSAVTKLDDTAAQEATASAATGADAAQPGGETGPMTTIDSKSLLAFFAAFSKHDFRYAYAPKTTGHRYASSREPLQGWEAGFALETHVVAQMMSDNKCVDREQVSNQRIEHATA